MKTRTQILAGALAAVLALSACSADTEGDLDDAVDGAAASAIEGAEDVTGTTLGDDAANAIARLNTSLDVVSTQLGNADVAPEVSTAWIEVQARVADAIVEAQANADFDASDLRSALDSFETQVASADVPAEFETAWADFRTNAESFITSLAS